MKENPHQACQLIWQRIAETGETKIKAIINLFNEGKLDKGSYRHDCPFCEYYQTGTYFKKDNNACDACPWPTYEDRDMFARCGDWRSPYFRFKTLKTPDQRAEVGKNMVKLLKSIDPNHKEAP